MVHNEYMVLYFLTALYSKTQALLNETKFHISNFIGPTRQPLSYINEQPSHRRLHGEDRDERPGRCSILLFHEALFLLASSLTAHTIPTGPTLCKASCLSLTKAMRRVPTQ